MFIPININELKNILNNNKLLKNTVGKISSICTTGQQIVLNARRIGLNVTSSYDTPGDGFVILKDIRSYDDFIVVVAFRPPLPKLEGNV